MARQPRFVPANSLQHIVDTTFQGRFLLRPSAQLNSRFLGVLGRAQRKFDMPLCAVTVLSSHYHLLARPKDGDHLATFMCWLKTNLAKELGTRLHNWPGRTFGKRYRAIPVSTEEAAQVQVLSYILSQGPKENLVDTVRQWPGVHSAAALIDGKAIVGQWIDRTAQSAASTKNGPADEQEFAHDETVILSPLPCWQHLEDAARRHAIRDLVDDIDQKAALARRLLGHSSLGVERVLAMSPHYRPNQVTKRPQPRCHAIDRQIRRSIIEIYQEVISAFREAAAMLHAGDRTVTFPEGTFPPAQNFVSFTKTITSTRGQPV